MSVRVYGETTICAVVIVTAHIVAIDMMLLSVNVLLVDFVLCGKQGVLH